MTEEEFVQAVERYGDTIYRVAYSCLKNRADVKEVNMQTSGATAGGTSWTLNVEFKE